MGGLLPALACVLVLCVPPTSAISGHLTSALPLGRPDIRLLLLGASERSTRRPASASGRTSEFQQRDSLEHMRGGGDNVRCGFEVRVENTKPGDTVLLLGSGALHNWDKSQATALTTTKDAFPWWWTEVPIPCGDTLEFKFAIRSAEGVLTWEPGVNRQAVVPDDATHLFTFNYGDHSTPAPRGMPAANKVEPKLVQGAAPEPVSLRKSQQATRSASPPPQNEKEGSSAPPNVLQGDATAAHEPVSPRNSQQVTQNEEKASSAPEQKPVTPAAPAIASAVKLAEIPVDAQASRATALAPNATARAAAAKTRFGASLKRTPALYSSALLAVVNGTNVAAANGGNATTKAPFWKGLLMNVLRIFAAPVTLPIWSLYKVVSTALRILSRVYASIHAIFFEADPEKFEVVPILIESILRAVLTPCCSPLLFPPSRRGG